MWAETDGRATVWRRVGEEGKLVREEARFRPWLLVDSLRDFEHVGAQLDKEKTAQAKFTYRELNGNGALRFVVSAPDSPSLTVALLHGASCRLGNRVKHIRDLNDNTVLMLAPEEQYLVATGRTYFRDLSFDQLHRLQFDLETTGLHAEHDRIFMVSLRLPNGQLQTIESATNDNQGEAALIRELMAIIKSADPDVIENHNLHGFDIPFLHTRAQKLGVPLQLGRTSHRALLTRGSRRGAPSEFDRSRRVRYVAPGRELIDTLDAVRRYDFSARELPSHGLKAVARHFGFAGPEREYIRGDQIFTTYQTDPARVRRYALDDVIEVEQLARMLGGAAFALARMAPRRYERLADAGAATGVIDPLLVRAYLRAGEALPAHADGDGTTHTGAALHLFATGAAHCVVKADVASLYPSLMREYRIGPSRDTLGAMLALVDRLVEQRLAAKARAQAAEPGSAERYTNQATSAAMKLVVNSAYGYLGAGGSLTRFADVHAANEVTRRGRETLGLMCRELAVRGVTLLEADTDGVYFAVPEDWTENDERRVVAEVAALLPKLVQLEFEGRYAAMLSHEPKNYALLSYGGKLILRGVAFRSSRAEPFGEMFLRKAITGTLVGDVTGVRDAYVQTLSALRRRDMPTHSVSSKVRLSKTSAQYLDSRASRRELSYEALLAIGRTTWSVGERVRVYRTPGGGAAIVEEIEDAVEAKNRVDNKNYDVEYYARLLHDSFAARLETAYSKENFETLFSDPRQPSLFTVNIALIKPILTQLSSA